MRDSSTFFSSTYSYSFFQIEINIILGLPRCDRYNHIGLQVDIILYWLILFDDVDDEKKKNNDYNKDINYVFIGFLFL